MAWFHLLRESRGRLVDRQMTLGDSVYAPSRLKNWEQVCEDFRKWEAQVEDLENITECRLGDNIKAQALLRLIPTDLKEMCRTQAGLEG